ncbi:CLUMA_CG008342, isoform A [Clunio marinus]|uniref:CLUMA_CG008342, isoform A n=1 Tax=Clunio marinus TaxID=568069 RepID=A0A1J1I512_9DIPT|nr:CLUMA_CG008342, isoform A [Clunio marinus]
MLQWGFVTIFIQILWERKVKCGATGKPGKFCENLTLKPNKMGAAREKAFILSHVLMIIKLVVAMMQVGNLPLPLPILAPALHADFPPVHIGIKVSLM